MDIRLFGGTIKLCMGELLNQAGERIKGKKEKDF
jgi:hypothetical protein